MEEFKDEPTNTYFTLRRILCFCSILLSLAMISRKSVMNFPTKRSLMTHPIAIEPRTARYVDERHHSDAASDLTDIIDTSRKLETVDLCDSQWTNEKLIGRCWGLTTSTEHPNVKGTIDDKVILDADECKRICCHLGSKCITWQYWAASRICKVGRHVRLGPEAGGSPRWCEPAPPRKWEGGRRNLQLNPFNQSLPLATECQWAAQQPGQCFGLGPERTNSTGGRLSAKDCGAGCCSVLNCWLWQHLPDRGCFYNENELREAPFCDQYAGEYIGGRKKSK